MGHGGGRSIWVGDLQFDPQTTVDDILIPDARYQRLGIDRSAHMKAILARDGGVEETRIFLLDLDDKAGLEDGRFRLELAVTG